MSASLDTGIRLSTEKALMTFTDTDDQRHYWSGFAVYCMEVAVSFIKTYQHVIGGNPPGIGTDALKTKYQHATERITVREIRNFVEGGALNEDFRGLFDVLQGKLHPELERSKTEMEDKNKQIDKLTEDLQRAEEQVTLYERQIVDSIGKLANDILRINQSQTQYTGEIRKLNETLQKMKEDKQQLARHYIDEMKELKAAQADEDIKARIQKIIDMMYGGDSIQSIETSVRDAIADNRRLVQRNGELEREIADLRRQSDQHPGAGGGLALTPEDEAWLQTLIGLTANTEDASEEIEKLLDAPLKDTELKSFGPFQQAMETVAKYVKTSRPFILAMRRFQEDVESEDVITCNRKHRGLLTKKLTTRHWMTQMFSCLLGTGKSGNFQALTQEYLDQSLSLQEYPYLKLTDQPLRLVVGTDVNPPEEPQSIPNFIRNVAKLTIVRYQKLVLHMFNMLRLVHTNNLIPTADTYKVLTNVVICIFSEDILVGDEKSPVDIMKLMEDNGSPRICLNVLSHALVANFPYHLFHSGFYIDLPGDDQLQALRKRIEGVDPVQRKRDIPNVTMPVKNVTSIVKTASIGIQSFNDRLIAVLVPIPVNQ